MTDGVRIRVTPEHAIEVQKDLFRLVEHPPARDFVVRRVCEKLANGEPLITGELVVAGKDTLDQHPLARDFPLHFRKTYYPTCFHQDPERELRQHAIAAAILSLPPAIGCTRTSFRSCFIPGTSLDKLAPFSLEPPEANLRLVEGMSIPARIGLWQVLEKLHARVITLHRGGLAHGDLYLHNVIVSTAPIGVHLIDFESASQREESDSDEAWAKTCALDLAEVRKAAIYLLVLLGPQPGDLAAGALHSLDELYPDATRLRQRVEAAGLLAAPAH